MENKSISLSIDEAKYMYDSNDEVIRNIALKAYSKEQLSFDFTKIKTFEELLTDFGYRTEEKQKVKKLTK